MSQANLRVIDGEQGQLAPDAPFAEFCSEAVRAAGGNPDEFWYEPSACSFDGRIRILAQWCRDSLPAWALSQRPSERLKVIDPRLIEAITDWKGQCLLLAGVTGVGKTTAAVHVLLGFWERRIRLGLLDPKRRPLADARWLKAGALERARREHPLGQGEAPIVVSAKEATILVIDDLGQESNRGDTALFDVLDARYEGGLSTIITTGIPIDELGARYGNHVLRRLTDHSRGCRLGEAW